MSITDSASGLDEESLETVYGWVDEVPLTRPKKNISRDFSDGVLFAEMIHYYFPNYVDMHNYTASNGSKGKTKNWNVLNRKVLRRLNFELADDVISNLCKPTPFVIEKVLMELKTRIDQKMEMDKIQPPPPISSFRAKESDQPEADQHFGWKGKGTKGQKLPPKASVKDPIMPSSGPQRQKGGNKNEPDLTMKYEEKVHECLSKDETIAVLQAKTRRLEHLLNLKDIRINELQSQVEHLRPTGGIK
ncbi:sperm flagellar protein 1-like isoform X2 [Pecten maximus]|uniref:sperm flagellar protein 1-like isoform X2 n=1 Tax=Pecten maximus TaxID=6579 RepID=UPI0014586CFD|nr:sperm flagellar protein 1-like isoform X2 [Pecten maximus]